MVAEPTKGGSRVRKGLRGMPEKQGEQLTNPCPATTDIRQGRCHPVRGGSH